MAPPLLVLRNARAHIATQQLFAGLDLAIERGDRVALVGRNGSGKSTLLRAMAGEQELDDGERFLQPRTAVVYLPQEPRLGAGPTVLDEVLRGLPPDHDPVSDRHLALTVLARLGMAPGQPATGLSGGEARRVAIARALLGQPDVLLLDEPTNHLDIAGIEWLEGELDRFTGALVVVSHDRAFLDRLARKLWWLDRGRLHQLDAGFASFAEWSEAILTAEEAEIARLDKRLEAEQHWLHRGVTARRKRNMGRLRRLESLRAERRARMAPTGQVRLEAERGNLSGRVVIEAEQITKALGGREIVHAFSTRILRGDRIGIIGPNGCGKTTLIRLLTGELTPDTGEVRLGANVSLARFDQNRLQLAPEKTPWETLAPDGGDSVNIHGRWQHVVGYLRDFLFREEQARQPIKALSGGERNRLLLARILLTPANLLVLDEPTNDLDIETLELLEEMLADWEGTLLLVSHDRAFLDRLVTSTIAFEGAGQFGDYVGGYSDWVRQRPAPSDRADLVPARPAARASERPAPALGGTRLRREIDKAQARLDALQAEIAALESRLADGGFYTRDPTGFAAASQRLEHARAELPTLEDRWLELEMLREQAG
jgi:ATP-binding cassette subfamily F protein uup